MEVNREYIKNILKYALFFVGFLIASRAGFYGVIFPFAFGLYFALIWCNQKIYLLAPMFLISSILCDFSFVNIISTVFCVCFSFVVIGIHLKLKKSINFSLLCVYTVLSQTGFLIANIYFNGLIFESILSIFVGLLFMIASKTIFEVVLIRGLVYKLNSIETICAFFLLFVISSGLCEIDVLGIEIIKIFAIFTILMLSYVLSPYASILSSCVIGVGLFLTTGTTEFFIPFVILALVVACLKVKNKFIPVLASFVVEFVMGYYLNLYSSYGFANFISVIIGGLCFLCLPSEILEKIKNFFTLSENDIGMRNVVNRSRESLCKRLYSLSEVFGEMDYVFRSMLKKGMSKEDAKKYLINEVKENVCSKCPDRNLCHRQCFAETNVVFQNLISSALERGKTTLLDIPPYLTSRCCKIPNLVGTINEATTKYYEYVGVMQNIDASKMLIAEQLAGVGKIMKNLAGEVSKNISFDGNRENAIINELSFNNVLCSDAVIYEQNTNVVSVTLVIRKQDTNKKIVSSIVSKVCKNKMVISAIESSKRAGWNVLTLKSAPKYDVAFGSATCKKDGSAVSGDCYSIIRIDGDKYLLALCDGMGSGEKAEKASSLAIGLVENFYKAGFDNDIILSSINKLLSINKDEIFSALDICVVDIREGIADFVKMGAPNSFIKHLNTIEEIKGEALPIGIVQNIEPSIMKKVLLSGDMIFLMTDGITECFESDEKLLDFINNLQSLNPQNLAEEVMNKALASNFGKVRDDMTIIVAKIYSLEI